MQESQSRMPATIRLKIRRQQSSTAEGYWEHYEIPYRENLNVISALIEIRKNPVTAEGKSIEPPAWEAVCLEEVCGSCTMLINGRVRQACTALIEDVAEEKGDTYELT